jgi:hypothetical protein
VYSRLSVVVNCLNKASLLGNWPAFSSGVICCDEYRISYFSRHFESILITMFPRMKRIVMPR